MAVLVVSCISSRFSSVCGLLASVKLVRYAQLKTNPEFNSCNIIRVADVLT